MKPEHLKAIENIDADRKRWMKTELMVDLQITGDMAETLIDEYFGKREPAPTFWIAKSRLDRILSKEINWPHVYTTDQSHYFECVPLFIPADKPSPGNETITGKTVRGERCQLPPTEHERIWLEPAGAPDRCWCQDNVWGEEAVEYVRVDLLSPAPAPHVKPLEWVQMDDGSTFHAQSILGRWARWEGHYLPPEGYGGIPCDDPIAAAQADYESRILSALITTAPQTNLQPFAWTWKHPNEGEEHRQYSRHHPGFPAESTYVVKPLYDHAPAPEKQMEVERLRRMVERRDEFIIGKGLWDQFKEASREAE